MLRQRYIEIDLREREGCGVCGWAGASISLPSSISTSAVAFIIHIFHMHTFPKEMRQVKTMLYHFQPLREGGADFEQFRSVRVELPNSTITNPLNPP